MKVTRFAIFLFVLESRSSWPPYLFNHARKKGDSDRETGEKVSLFPRFQVDTREKEEHGRQAFPVNELQEREGGREAGREREAGERGREGERQREGGRETEGGRERDGGREGERRREGGG